jgi:hypothetical protein
MKLKCKFRLWDGQLTIDVENGSQIEDDKIGYIGHNYGAYPDYLHYEKINKDDIKFILDNDIECEIEMIDEFDIDEDISSDYISSSDLIPKLHKGKVIIYLK